MKSDVPALVLAASVTWLTSGHAYMVGLFLPYGVQKLALLGFNDVLAAAAPALLLTTALLISIVGAVFWFSRGGGRWPTRSISRRRQAFGVAIVIVLLFAEAGVSSGRFQVHPPIGTAILPIIVCMIAALGLQSSAITGRVAAGFLVTVLLAYQMGVLARPDHPGANAVSVLQADGVLCGDLLSASPAGLFLIEPDNGARFIQAGDYRSLSWRACQPNEVALTPSPELR